MGYNKQPIRVLHILGTMNRGGVETWLVRMLRQLDREKLQFDFLVHNPKAGAYDEEIRSLGSEVLVCPHLKQPWRYVHEFRRLIKEYGPYDILHSHVYLYSGLTLRLAQQAGIPGRLAHIYPHVDLKAGQLQRHAYRRLMTHLISRHSTTVVGVSASTLESFQQICDCSRQQTSTLYCGIDLAPFQTTVDVGAVRERFGLPHDQPLVTYVARFHPHKNHLQALRVAAAFAEEGIPAHLVLAGASGPTLEVVQAQARDLANVSIVVDAPDVTELMLASDVFFFPSTNEGLGVVALEAAAAGLPVVATDLPTIREACLPAHHRLLFPPNDDEMARKHLQAILQDDAGRATRAAEARAWASKFSIEESLATLTGIYRGTLDSP